MPDIPPVTRHRHGISLTPLVDVIFLLLIFFMLTSQIAPFSLISFSTTKAGTSEAKPLALPPKDTSEAVSFGVLITVLNGGIAINGQHSSHGEIDTVMKGLREKDVSTAIISPRSSATVQDLITVLEAVKKASFKSITIRK